MIKFTLLSLIFLSSSIFACEDLYKRGRCTDIQTASIKELESCAESGDLESQINLAAIYWNGSAAIPADKEESFKWTLMAAENECPKAQLLAGEAYYYGNGAQPSVSKAIYWWKKAIANGNADAMCNVGYAKYSGDTGEEKTKELDKVVFSTGEAWCWLL